ncbi:hypothetical protein E2562_027689 [Oryza meyeriana var. granulata]|uniref:Uncharacterized protein n=1 Tax=Oryza meyeriana var. granulata TaxID=110450 RepID=A0A6G1CRZ7_9ORYZ|nr:hypothetical protein E2562_027689 [Oryza meyeriana var. granulata]
MEAAAVVPRVSPTSWFTVDGAVAVETLMPPLLVVADGAEDDEALRVEELEHLLGDMLRTLSRLDSKRGRLQGQIAAASRGRRGGAARPPRERAPAEDALLGGDGAPVAYTRKGAGAVRRWLRAAAGDVKKARERLEAVVGKLEAALVDAKERLALQQMRATAA